MIKRIAKNNLKPFFLAASAFLISYFIGLNLVVPSFLIILYAYLKFRRIKYNFINTLLLFLIFFSTGYFIIEHGFSVYFIPFSFIPLLATLLFNSLELSLVITLAASLSIASILVVGPFPLLALFLISGILSSILVKSARRPKAIIRSGIIVGLAQVLLVVIIDSFKISMPGRYPFLFLNGVICAIFAVGVLPIFEYLFKIMTNISLVELFDHQLLQKMKLEAIGTYHHSIVVGNLSEAACEVIGANALLARIGAYYHDIGKIGKAGYFSENQEVMQSKHDMLSPEMSKLVIMSHVKEGVDLAKEYKLNPVLIDFIQQHHGNSLVYYFYRRALESLEEDREVKEEGFRYPGPKPNTKETAVVLLADSVEAATRALREPAPENIKEVVHKIINNKFIDGQLDECDLTLKDLEKISSVFVRILSGIYHNRIIYPEETVKSEDKHNKSPKENSHPSTEDKRNSS